MKLIGILALVTLPVWGQTWGTQDIWFQCNTSTPGTVITTAIMGNCTVPSTASKYTLVPSTPTSLTVATSQGGMGGSVTVGVTTYPIGSPTQSIAYDSLAGFQHFDLALGSITDQGTVVTISGFITFGEPASGGTNHYYDLIAMQDWAGTGTVIQYQTGNTTNFTDSAPHAVGLESSFGGTHHGDGISLTTPIRLAFTFQANEATGLAQLAFADPTTFVQYGPTLSVSFATGRYISSINIGNGEAGASSGTTYFENLMIDYSNHQAFPNFPTPNPSVGRILGGKSILSGATTQ